MSSNRESALPKREQQVMWWIGREGAHYFVFGNPIPAKEKNEKEP